MVDLEQFMINRVTTFRHKMHLTQKEVGQIIYVSPSFIANIENARSAAKYNLRHISLLAEYFQLNPLYFLVSDENYIKIFPDGKL